MVLEQSGLARRTGLGEGEVRGVVLEVSRAVLHDSLPSTALCLYQTGLTLHHWGERFPSSPC